MKKIIISFLVLLVSLSLVSCKNMKEHQIKDDRLTSMNIDDQYRVYYQIFIGSFSDSNKDGIGDLNGIVKRFDYLNDGNDNSGKSLGIEGIWLSPMMPSKSYHKYDVIDYYSIDKQFGTLDDFKDLLNLAHDRNVKIIIDLVVNHTSSYHPWFLEFKKAHANNDTTNKYYTYYTYVNEQDREDNKIYYKINNDKDTYYEGNFSSQMPELDFDNNDVRDEFEEIIKYWLELGVDGFRLDAAKYVYLHENEKNIDFWNWFMETAKSYKDDVYVVGEVWSSERELLPYYENFNNFDFSFSQIDGLIAQTARITSSVSSYTNELNLYLDKVKNINSEAILSPFISNHDMDRAAGYLSVDDGLMHMAANLYILGPGNPYIYYGEEIGLKGVRGTANTDANRRLKMLWGDKDTVKNPVGSSYGEEYQTNGTVKQQLKDSNSLINHYKKLIMIRKAVPEIARGTYTPIESTIFTFGGFISTYNNTSVIVLHNTGFEEITIKLKDYTNLNFNELLAYVGINKASFNVDNQTLTLEGLTSVVLK